MKKVLFVRHAKSSWADLNMTDRDRPLNKRGKRDAPVMAQRCKNAGLVPDLILSSPAVRARMTAEVFHDVLAIDREIHFESYLYHADISDIEEAINLVDDEINCIAVFAHNPGLTYLANDLDSNRYIDNVPTCGVVVAKIDIEEWRDFSVARSRLVDFLYPKQLIQ